MSDKEFSGVRVCVRFRPQNSLERQNNAARCIQINSQATNVKLFEEAGNVSGDFSFDRIFDESSRQAEVYNYVARPLVDDLLLGYNCTIFAYGQTGSGKTYTMMGQLGDSQQNGLIPRMVSDIFTSINSRPETDEFTVRASYVELYLEKIHDLVNPEATDLRVRESPQKGVYVEGMTELYVSSPQEMLNIMAEGSAHRAIASTRMNQDSSRSHSLFCIQVEQRDTNTGVKKLGKMYLVDLAGSEMVGKTNATGQTLQEAKMINKSLSALGNVIKALTEATGHVPYRDSKLTRVLQDSLGGNAKTSLIITASGFSYNLQETLSTLRFGNRAKRIKNKPKVNEEKSIDEYRALLTSAESRENDLRRIVTRLEHELMQLKTQMYPSNPGTPSRANDIPEVVTATEGLVRERRVATVHYVEDAELRTLYESLREMANLSDEVIIARTGETDSYTLIRRVMEVKLTELRVLMDERDRLGDLLEEKEIEVITTKEREKATMIQYETLNQLYQEVVMEQQALKSHFTRLEMSSRNDEFKLKENQFIIAQLRDDVELLVRTQKIATDPRMNCIGPRCSSNLNKLSMILIGSESIAGEGASVEVPRHDEDEEDVHNFTDADTLTAAAEIHGEVNSSRTGNRTRKPTPRELELEGDLQALTAKMIELRVNLEEERDSVAQLYEAINSGEGRDPTHKKLAEEAVALRKALDRKCQEFQQLTLVLINSETMCKRMSERISNRERHIQSLEQAVHEFQDMHRSLIETQADRIVALEKELKESKAVLADVRRVFSGRPSGGNETNRVSMKVVKPIKGGGIRMVRASNTDASEDEPFSLGPADTTPLESSSPKFTVIPESESLSTDSASGRADEELRSPAGKKEPVDDDMEGLIKRIKKLTDSENGKSKEPRTAVCISVPTVAAEETSQFPGLFNSPVAAGRILRTFGQSTPNKSSSEEGFLTRTIRSLSATRRRGSDSSAPATQSLAHQRGVALGILKAP